MNRLSIQILLAVGVLVASAILDFGSHANAAYLTMIEKKDSPRCGGCAATDKASSVTRDLLHGFVLPAAQLQGSGGMSSTGSSTSSSFSSFVAYLPRIEQPVDGLVVFFHEPDSAIRLSAFIDSLLDPPRLA